MPSSDLDALCVNTIRGLCMDAIQKANSGHPGTPMGIAPVAYTLWQRYLRFDPQDPIWPNRDRFVLSEGHASALLWSLLHLAGVRGRRSGLRGARTAGGVARRPEVVPPARLPLPGPSGVPLDERRRDDHRSPRPRAGHLGGDGGGRPVAGQPVQPRRLPALRLRRLRPGRRRLHDGRDRVRGGVVRRPPAPVEPVLDLRLQPGDHRGAHGHHLHGGRGGPVRVLRLEHHRGGRRQRPGRGEPGPSLCRGRAGAPDAGAGPQPHRLRVTGGGHAQGARRALRRGGREGDEALPRSPGGRGLRGAPGRLRRLRRRDRGQGPRRPGRLADPVRRLSRRPP